MKTRSQSVPTQATKTKQATKTDSVSSIKLLPQKGRVVDGYRVYPAAVEPKHLTTEQIKKALAA